MQVQRIQNFNKSNKNNKIEERNNINNRICNFMILKNIIKLKHPNKMMKTGMMINTLKDKLKIY
jgi:hypothetical protein